jgi:DNA polymerase-3 subunit alpha
MGSAPALYAEATKAGIKPIIGCEMYVTDEELLIDGDKEVLKERRHLTVLALSHEGYMNLVKWVSASMERPLYYNGPRISIDRMVELAPYDLHHNVILSGCMGGELCQCLLHSNGASMEAGAALIEGMASVFPNFYIEIHNHKLDKFMGQGLATYEEIVKNQEAIRSELLSLSAGLGVPCIVTNDSHYQRTDQRRAHLAMLARKQHRRSSEAHRAQTHEAVAEGFAAEYGYFTNYMRPMEAIAATLPKWAERESIQSIHDIVEEANVSLEPLNRFSYALPRSPYADPIGEIRKRSARRLKGIANKHGSRAVERFEYELAALKEFGHYLLIYSDIIRMCRDSGIYTWTRGSAANSLVNFCLGIHEIDPIRYKLTFERFVNPARAKFPDVDIDIEAHRRDDVVRMVQEYMAELGQEAVPICTYSTLSNRAAFRLMAEAAGVPQEKIDEYAKLLPQMIDSGMVEDDEEAYELLKEELGIDIHQDAAAVFDSIGGVSQHACALAIGTPERPLSDWVPTYRIGSSNALVTQYNMKWIEQMGFLKLDLLKLDTLSIMHGVARDMGEDMAWLDNVMQTEPGIYDDLDAATFKLLCEGRTEGVHSFQGKTQRRGCVEVAPQTVDDLVAVQALYRPSGTRTDADKHFVARRFQREDWENLNDVTAQFLDETYGIAIYQEQIMSMGFALGMSGEEVDDLYKAIKTAKGVGRGARELFEKFEPTFRKHALNHMPENEADILWAEWEKLQGYTFNRGHATSYAILGLKNANLKAHAVQSHFVNLLSRYPKNPRYLADAIQEGLHFEPPDINVSAGGFSRGGSRSAIRVGLLRVHGVGPGAVGEIVRNQPFASLDDLRERTHSGRVDKTVIENLGAVGALESIGIAGDGEDRTQFDILNFVLGEPKAMKGAIPTLPRRKQSTWEYLGLERGVSITEGKRFCSKLFWLPGTDIAKKASPNGQYSAFLLEAVDENGIPFDLIVSESKAVEVKLIKWLDKKAKGAVICADGQVSMPFARGTNTGFKLWGISGAENGNPMAWHIDEETAKGIIYLADEKRKVAR